MDDETLLFMQEQAAVVVASLTGFKAQFVAAGWDERNAELMVIALMNQQANQK
jgi:hypothetical protein